MEIVIVGGGTAGWITALIASSRHPNHNITVIENSTIGVVGVGESTTGIFTGILVNWATHFGCNLQEFIVETGATAKYGIKHKGWTNNIDDYYIGPIDGTETGHGTGWTPTDLLFAWGLNKLSREDLLTLSHFGYWIHHGKSGFNKAEKDFIKPVQHAWHIDAHLTGKYFKKIACKRNNISLIDDEVVEVKLSNGSIKSILLESSNEISGDLFVDCSGFNKVLMKHLSNKWISYKDNLPLNTALPFQLKYKDDEMPEPYTTAWAQKNGWMWQIPLMDRKGCGYVFCDSFTTADKAQEEIETILGQEIDPTGVIKFDAGRQESAWVKNCVAIGLSSAFAEPLEATSIHCTIEQATVLFDEYVTPTIEDTLNSSNISIYNRRTRNLYDDLKDFLVLHYMGGRDDSEFWKYIKTGATQTEFVKELLEMVKSRMPSFHDFPQYQNSAGWPLYSYVMEGINLLDKSKSLNELENFHIGEGDVKELAQAKYKSNLQKFSKEAEYTYTYNEFIEHFRNIREDKRFVIIEEQSPQPQPDTSSSVLNAIFPIAVYNTKREDISETEAKEIEDIIKEGMYKNHGNSTSENNYIFDTKLKNVKKFFEEHIAIYVEQVIAPKNEELDFYITQSWINITKPGELHHGHFHSNSIISGVFYIATEEDDKISFIHPNGKVKETIKFEPKEYNAWNATNWSFQANNNELILFPSYLDHQVDPNENATTDRISISFNTFVRGAFGDQRGLSELIL